MQAARRNTRGLLRLFIRIMLGYERLREPVAKEPRYESRSKSPAALLHCSGACALLLCTLLLLGPPSPSLAAPSSNCPGYWPAALGTRGDADDDSIADSRRQQAHTRRKRVPTALPHTYGRE
jgi:hypothetical protein